MYDRFHRGISSLDSAINAVNNIAILTNRDSRFRIFRQDPVNLGANPVLLNELRSHFNGLLLSYQAILDAGIVFSKDIVLTRQQIFYFPVLYPFYENYIQCRDLSMDEWYALLSTTSVLAPAQSYTSMTNGSYEGFTYSVQWKAPEGPELNLLYATLPVNKVLPLLADDEIISQSHIRMYDHDKRTLYDFSGEKWNPRERSRVLTGKSEILPVFFDIMVPESVINNKMKPVRELMLVFALITVLFIIGLSLLFAYKWSEPMRRLLISINSTKIFRSEYEQNLGQTNPGLWNYFRRMYTDISKSINAMDTRLEDSIMTIAGQASLLREQIFDKALYRGIYGGQDWDLFRSMFAEFPKVFQLALIYYDPPANSSFQETAMAQVRLINALKGQLENVFIHGTEESTIVLLLPLREKGESWYQKLQDLRDNLGRRMDLSLRFSLSGIYERPSELNRAWQELQSIHVTLALENKEEKAIQFGRQILDYIGQNLYNPELYSTMVLDHFNISQPTLQKLVKQVSGHTYLSYVETRRLTKARELLAEGGYTIQEVSVQCGFSNTNSFYKAFKRFYGFPPRDIKNNHKPGINP
jgi:AraC-like DNA-binding protein